VGVAPAVANAVYHATGRRVRELPITPDKLLCTTTSSARRGCQYDQTRSTCPLGQALVVPLGRGWAAQSRSRGGFTVLAPVVRLAQRSALEIR
jgi:hypothetical protein